MKKVLVLLLGLVFFNTSAQKMSPAYLEGQWTSNGEGTEITIKGTNKHKLIITEVSSYSGREVKVMRYYMDKKKSIC